MVGVDCDVVMVELNCELQDKGFLLIMIEDIINWVCNGLLYWMIFGLVCCVVEMMQVLMLCYDVECFGIVLCVFLCQFDLMIVVGMLINKMVLVLCKVYDQMFELCYVISMGSCVNGGGYYYYFYFVVCGCDCIVLVDIYVLGCLFMVEVLFYGIL